MRGLPAGRRPQAAGGAPIVSAREPGAAIDLDVKRAVYAHFAEHAWRPPIATIAARLELDPADVRACYGRLAEQRLLVLEADGDSIRMAPPFSGVPTQHVAEVGDNEYFANCAWDVLGIVAALGRPGVVHSRCEQSKAILRLEVGPAGPEPSDWLFHTPIPAAAWWDDIVFT